ncbi:HNH endonuclease [Roseovarius sp.]|uniref:HNH endonuclease n=1 Tax=Roseovarius sp. TaxID=1486281 RepID=UPI003BABE697
MGNLKDIRRTKMIAQNGRCYYCDLPMWDAPAASLQARPPKALRCTAEHLLPRCEGGRDASANIVAACWFCNSRRHRRSHPLPPDTYRRHVQKRMAAGKWLTAQCRLFPARP